MRVTLNPDNASRVQTIAKASSGLFPVFNLVNLIVAEWLDVRENEQRLKALYARSKKPVSRQ